MKKIIPVLIVLMILGGFGWTMNFLYQKSQTKPVVFKTSSAKEADIVKKIVATGAIVPRKEIALKPRVSGVVEVLYVQPGDAVKTGAEIAKIKIIPNVASVNQAQAALTAAQIRLDNAQQELKRNQDMLSKGLIAEAVVNQTKLTYDLAKSEVFAAGAQLKILKEGATSGKGATNIVTSTVDGVVLDAPIREGESVIESNTFNDGTTIVTVADMNDIIFKGKVDESEVGRLKEGMELEIKVGALQDKVLKGKLEYIAPKGADTEGTIQFEIRAKITDTADALIRANYSANANIVLERRDKVLALDEKLLQFDDGKPFVEIETGPQKFEKRTLEVGLSDGIKIEVKSGITSKDKIKDPSPPKERDRS
jgi:HlyD family secretion protein